MNARFLLPSLLALGLALPAAAQQLAPGTLAPPAPGGNTLPGDPLATPPDVAQAKAAVLGWFAGFEFVPRPEHYARLGPSLAPALVQIAGDADTHLAVRARALSAMVHVDDAASIAALAATLEDPDAPSILRRKSALVLADREGPAAVDRLTTAFVNAADDVLLREACARGLRLIGKPAHAARDALLRAETAPTVRGLLLGDKRIGLD